ncbi:unnamed protein product [Staurois parvus]|uniref:Uncharacterized protein n=1 Tax=Staurois parvus TaxID=386267 RepID=A0ABN9DZN2_9NEOB|nr:unnamed protein product [Staurois parvus]
MQAGRRTKHSGQNVKKNYIFLNFQICRRFSRPYVPTSQGPEHRSRMPASAGGDAEDAAGDTSWERRTR